MVIALVAVIGAGAGFVMANNHNNGIKPRWRAQAPVAFFQIEEDAESTNNNSRSANTSASSNVDAESERNRAGLLLADTLAENPRLSIQVDRENNTLLFIAVGRDGDATLTEALDLRSEYQALGATVLSVDQITATMETLFGDITRLKEEISALEVTDPEPEPSEVTAQRDALVAEISTLDQRQAQISIWIQNPELRPTEDDFFNTEPDTTRAAEEETEETEPPAIISLSALEEERAKNEVILFRLRNELALVPDPPEARVLTPEEELEKEALQLDLDELELQYVGLFRRLDGRPPGGFTEEPIVTDETQSPRSVALSGILGLLVGTILAGLGIMGYDQLRQPVWAASDLDRVSSLGFVNRRRDVDDPDVVWYPSAMTQRRRDIQTLRAATDAVTGERPAILGFFGVGVSREEVGELAADLAASYTVADRNVLLVDASSFHPNTGPEFGGENTLNDVLMTALLPDEAAMRINEFLDAADQSMTGLTAVHVDAESHDPIDVFASPNCRVLMEVAATRYDMVVVAGPDIADPLADAVIRRVGIVALIGYVGYTETSRVETAAAALRDRKAEVAGLVLLEGRRQPVKEQVADYLRGSRDVEVSEETIDEPPTEIEVDLSAESTEPEEAEVEESVANPDLPRPVKTPTGTGKRAKAKAEDEADAEPESVLEQAKAKRAETKAKR